MIFNKDYNGSDELNRLTGSYFANNNFEKVEAQIAIATDEVINLIGPLVYERAEAAYLADAEPGLVEQVQRPIAILATLRMYQRNDLSHEDSGRRMKIDKNAESIPWEWQIDKDDKTHLDDYFRACDSLVRYLDRHEADIPEWKESAQKIRTRELFIRDADAFDQYYPIGRSGRMYHLLAPFMREVQRRTIRRVLGDDYPRFLAADALTDEEARQVAELICPAVALYALALAIERLPLGVIPQGVVRRYGSASQSMRASEPAGMEEIREVVGLLRKDAAEILGDLRTARNPGGAYRLIPRNDPRNKYMSV